MTDPLLGQTLKDAYRIDQLLADGGMSRIYLVEQISLSRKAVIKVLLPSFNDEDFIQLFLREARICSQLNHPNIVSVFDFGKAEDGLVYLVMEYLEGASLADIVQQSNGLTLANIMWLMEPLCSAIHAAHQQQVVHRDLKPGNVMVARISGDGSTVKVVDFGISKPMQEENLKHTQLGTIMGTPGYLAPEQIRGAPITHLADIYGLGAILHFMVTGEAPYRGASREIIMNKQLSQNPPPLHSYQLRDPSCVALQAVIYKALAIEPEQRYQSALELWQAVKNCLQIEDNNYRVVFKGELQSNHSLPQVQQALQNALQLDTAQLAQLFSGTVTVRQALSLNDAKQLQNTFKQAGALCYIEEIDDSTRLTPSLPQTITPQAISVASFVQAGAMPYVLDSPSAANPYIQSKPSVSQVQPATPHKKSHKLRAALIAIGLLSIIAASIYAIPTWRYQVADLYMYKLGAAKPQRGISTDNIRIGMSAAFSGSTKELGRAMQTGIKAYFKEVNAQGGIHGRKLELYALDDSYEPANTQKNLQQFLQTDNGAFALLGNVGTPTSQAILANVLDNKILMFGTLSGAQLLRNIPPDRYVFNYRASYAEETTALVHYFVKVLGINAQNIGVFYQDDSYGRDGLSGVANAVAQYGVNISKLATATYPRNTAQTEPAIKQLQAELPHLEGIIVIGTYLASARFTQQIRSLGYQGKIANVSFVDAVALAEELKAVDEQHGNGVIISQVVPMYNSHASAVLEYRAAMQKHYPNLPLDFVSLEGYLSAKIFCLALEKAGRYLTTETLITELEKLNQLDIGIGAPITYSADNHQASQQVWGTVINDKGELKELDLQKIRM